MPELPEVETIRVGLSSLLPGQRITGVWHDWPKSFPNAPEDVAEFLIGATVTAVNRRAKVLLIELDTSYTLVIHLRMTGQLVYVRQAHKLIADERFGAGHPSPSLIGKLPDKSTRVIFDLQSGKGRTLQAQLFFNDQRKFGWIKLLPTVEVPNIDFMRRVGPEPLSADFTPAQFRQRILKRPNTNIKAALLDQSVIAGIGNIYADESLWAARLHPASLVKNVSSQKLNKLFTAIRQVLTLSIEKGGSTDRNYVNAEGQRGSYLGFAKVFRRQGMPCSRCGTVIIKTRVAGRGTHTCPKCQRFH